MVYMVAGRTLQLARTRISLYSQLRELCARVYDTMLPDFLPRGISTPQIRMSSRDQLPFIDGTHDSPPQEKASRKMR
jgi:hypothetical protein